MSAAPALRRRTIASLARPPDVRFCNGDLSITPMVASCDATRHRFPVGEPAEHACAMPPGRRKMRKERDSCRGGCSAEHALCQLRRWSPQAVLAIQWLWSLSRLWVAATNRNSECTAALPLRMN